MPEKRHPELSEVGPCQLLAPIGKGGMGVVYRGFHRDFELDVAVKLLHPHLVEQGEFAERFLREAQLAARLNHPAIVRVFDCGRVDQHFYMVMELVQGDDLGKFIKANGPLPVRRALEIAHVVAGALGEALDAVEVIHRDVKPDNIILTPSGKVKLADLGLAKILGHEAALSSDETTAAGFVLGTPRYMSPEQFVDPSHIDHRADIFSLGATLFHMLSGKPPFSADSFVGLQQQISESHPPPLPDRVPIRVEELVLRMLSKEAAARFQTYDELCAAIRAVQDSVDDQDTVEETIAIPRSTVAAELPSVPALKTAGRILNPASPADNRVLLVVDMQNDFMPNGPLGVPGGDEIIPVINDLAARFSHVILTQDWHRPDHLSFASSHPGTRALDRIRLSYGQQRLWPDHCVQGTWGAKFHPALQIPHCELVIRKGYNREIDSYSAFFENDRQTPTGLAGYLRERGLVQLFVVGLATDFCVAYTALDGRNLGFEVTVIENACRGIDLDGSVELAWREMIAEGVRRA